MARYKKQVILLFSDGTFRLVSEYPETNLFIKYDNLKKHFDHINGHLVDYKEIVHNFCVFKNNKWYIDQISKHKFIDDKINHEVFRLKYMTPINTGAKFKSILFDIIFKQIPVIIIISLIVMYLIG